ncbi:MAG: hypothetical protein Q9180_004501 [Flavoplaca navasiana]
MLQWTVQSMKFLAAKLHVDALSTKTNIKELKKALENLSTDINDLYDNAIARIESQNQDYRTLAEKALRWVAYAFRPLPVQALQEAVAIGLVEPGEHKSDDEGIQDFNDEAILYIDDEAASSIVSILDACSGLLIHDETSGLVRLVHYTAQDYFDAHVGSRFEKAHTCIARECVTYLSYKCFQNPDESSSDLISKNSNASSDGAVAGSVSVSSGSRCYYLFDYATAFWAQHATTRELPVEIRQFLARNPRICLLPTSEYDVYAFLRGPSRNIGSLEVRHGCEIAAFYGIHDELQKLCSSIGEAEVLHDHLNVSFHLAVSNGQTRSTEILLDYGANINSEDECGRTALLTASWMGNLNLVQLLLDRGFDQDAQDQHGETALHRAVLGSHKSCVLALINHGADINSKDSNGMTALHAACLCGDPNLLNILLARGSNIDARNRWGQTPLFTALERLDGQCMLALIRHGADVNMQDNLGLTALHTASANGTLTLVAELAKHCATISMRNRAVWSLKFLHLSGPYSADTSLQFEANSRISYHIARLPFLHRPEYLKSILQLCELAKEARVWKEGVTALDVALLREQEEITNLLRIRETGHTLATAQPDIQLYTYLLNKHIIAGAEFRDIKCKSRVLRPPTSPNERVDEVVQTAHADSRRARSAVASAATECSASECFSSKLDFIESRIRSRFVSQDPFDVRLDMLWDIRAFMTSQYGKDNDSADLGSVIVLNGSALCAEATTCSEYVRRTWPSHGVAILALFSEAIENVSHEANGKDLSMPAVLAYLTDYMLSLTYARTQ